MFPRKVVDLVADHKHWDTGEFTNAFFFPRGKCHKFEMYWVEACAPHVNPRRERSGEDDRHDSQSRFPSASWNEELSFDHTYIRRT